jgi:thiol-disulfide isomerase/thioredoxin
LRLNSVINIRNFIIVLHLLAWVAAGRAQGKAVLYIFFLEDCVICQSYTPEINKLHKTYGEDLEFLLIFPNHRSKDGTIAEFRKKYKIDIPYKTDHYKTLSGKLGVKVTPEVVLTDAAGQIVYQGAIDDAFVSPGKKRKAKNHYLHDAIEAFLQKKKPDPSLTQAVGCFINYKENE